MPEKMEVSHRCRNRQTKLFMELRKADVPVYIWKRTAMGRQEQQERYKGTMKRHFVLWDSVGSFV